MDQFDQAQALEELHRDKALEAHRRSRRGDVSQLIIEGEICCRECNEPIEPERLKARPESVKCISCKVLEERGGM
jgi:phage/conjugal plasmid C-4 type zinc finger TraR family protein